MKLIINSFKNIWINKPLIINTKNKVIKLMGRNGIWKTNTIDSIVFCFYWISGLKSIWKSFSFSSLSDCEVEISDFHATVKNLKIKRISKYSSTRNITSLLYINDVIVNENDICKYLPTIAITSYILNPVKFISLSVNKRDEIINYFLNNQFNKTEKDILNNEINYNNINKTLDLDNSDEIVWAIHEYIVKNYNIKKVNESYEFYNYIDSYNEEDRLISEFIVGDNRIDEGLLSKIVLLLKADAKSTKEYLTVLESIKHNNTKNLEIIWEPNIEYDINELKTKKRDIDTILNDYNKWSMIKKDIALLKEKDKQILQIGTNKFLQLYVNDWWYSSEDWELYYKEKIINSSVINKYICKNELVFEDFDFIWWYNYKEIYKQIIEEIKDNKFRSYIIDNRELIIKWDNKIDYIVSLINTKIKSNESEYKPNISKEILNNFSILENAISVNKKDWSIEDIDTDKQKLIKQQLWDYRCDTTNDYTSELSRVKNKLEWILKDRDNYWKDRDNYWKEIITKLNIKLSNFNKMKDFCNVMEMKKIDFNFYNDNKRKFLLQLNMWVINKKKEKIDNEILQIKNYNHNIVIYKKLLMDKKENDCKLELNYDKLNKLQASVKLYNLFNKTRRELNIKSLNIAIKEVWENDYLFDGNYNLLKTNKNNIFDYEEMSGWERIMQRNCLSKVIGNITGDKFPFQLIDNLWELDDDNLARLELNNKWGNLVSFYSKISNDKKLSISY